MEENKVEITVSEYHGLLRMAERIAVVERLAETTEYLATGDVLAILGIRRKESGEK